jgi:hypothetical protein
MAMDTEGDAVEFRERLQGDNEAQIESGPREPKRGPMPRIIALIAFAALVLVALPTAWLVSGNGSANASQSPGATTVAVGESDYASLPDEPTDALSYEPSVSAGDSAWDDATAATSATPSGGSVAPRPACSTERYTVDPGDFGPGESYVVDTYNHPGTRAICGVVTGPAGERVRQVQLGFLGVGGSNCLACSTVTDGQGRYSITVPAGRFNLHFGLWDINNYIGGHLTPHGASYGNLDASLAVVDTRQGDAVVNIQLRRTIKVHVTAVDQDGLPVQGIQCWTSSSSSYYAGTSDAQGRCISPVVELYPFSMHLEDPLGRFASATYGVTYTLTAASPDVVVTLTLPFRLTATHTPTDAPATESPTVTPPSSPEASPSV